MLRSRLWSKLPITGNYPLQLKQISQLHSTYRLSISPVEQQVCRNKSFAIQRFKQTVIIPTQVANFHIEPCRLCSTSATKVVDKQLEPQEDGILKRVLKKVGFAPNSKTRLKVASLLLYESVADKINYLSFFQDFDLPNTFNSWFLVTELHVWMLLVRSMAEGAESGEKGRFLRNCIVEAMWSDVNTRAKKLGAANPSRTREQIEELSEQFQAALIAYDEGIQSDDRILAAALWRRFFEMNCDDYTKIERLVLYVRQQMVTLEQLSRQEFLNKSKIPWLPLEKVKVT